LNNRLIEYFETSEKLKYEKLKDIDHKYLTYYNETAGYKKMDEIIDIFSSPSKQLIADIHREISDNILGPPNFYSKPCFVNTRGWLTKPKSTIYGPNKMHTDGFTKGHLKVMIYPNGLNEDYGYFILNGLPIKDMPKGTAIMFHNSDVLHSGYPGKKYDRYSLEVTILESFIHIEQFHNGFPTGNHYKNLITPYMYVAKKKIFRS